MEELMLKMGQSAKWEIIGRVASGQSSRSALQKFGFALNVIDAVVDDVDAGREAKLPYGFRDWSLKRNFYL